MASGPLTPGARFPGAAIRRRRTAGAIRADINVTPLVDVVLVLLIIFMVVAPIISQGMPVELPRTTHHDRRPDDGKDLLLSLTREGVIYLRANPVGVRDVPRLLEEERKRTPGRAVYLQGDGQARFRDVRGLLRAIHKGASSDEIQLRTDELRPPPP
jgi:biopolymer transport protein ExbD